MLPPAQGHATKQTAMLDSSTGNAGLLPYPPAPPPPQQRAGRVAPVTITLPYSSFFKSTSHFAMQLQTMLPNPSSAASFVMTDASFGRLAGVSLTGDGFAPAAAAAAVAAAASVFATPSAGVASAADLLAGSSVVAEGDMAAVTAPAPAISSRLGLKSCSWSANRAVSDVVVVRWSSAVGGLWLEVAAGGLGAPAARS